MYSIYFKWIEEYSLENVLIVVLVNKRKDEDGIREIVDLWKNEDSGEIAPAWSEHLDWLIKRLISEQEA